MLSKLLSKKACAKCRFCCSFRRQSLWELPRVPLDFCVSHPLDTEGKPVDYIIRESNGMRFAVTDLRDKYGTDDPDEEVRCPFLDPETGCSLPDEDKPFECRMWPLRYMEMPEGCRKIALTPTCPEINRLPFSDMEELVNDGTGKRIMEYAKEYPFIIKKYREGFRVFDIRDV